MSIDILFDPISFGTHITFVCWGIDFAGPFVRACDIDVNYNLITGSEYANSREAIGTGWRRTMSQLYRMIEAAQTSPLESLYERVSRLEQEVSALKRNLPMG